MSRQSVLSRLPSRRSSHFTVQVRPSRPGGGAGVESVQPDPPGTFGVSPQCWTPPRLQSPSIAWRTATLNHDWTVGGGSTTAPRRPHPTTAPVSKHPGHGQPAEPGTERNGCQSDCPAAVLLATPPARPGLANDRRSSPPSHTTPQTPEALVEMLRHSSKRPAPE